LREGEATEGEGAKRQGAGANGMGAAFVEAWGVQKKNS